MPAFTYVFVDVPQSMGGTQFGRGGAIRGVSEIIYLALIQLSRARRSIARLDAERKEDIAWRIGWLANKAEFTRAHVDRSTESGQRWFMHYGVPRGRVRSLCSTARNAAHPGGTRLLRELAVNVAFPLRKPVNGDSGRQLDNCQTQSGLNSISSALSGGAGSAKGPRR